MSIEEIISQIEQATQEAQRMVDERSLLMDEDGYKEVEESIKMNHEIISLLKTHPEAQPNEPNGDGWISVEDRLPVGYDGVSICQIIIAYTVEGEVCTGWLNGRTWYLLCGEDDYNTEHGFGYITHWMPLPEPPEEEKR